MDEMNVKAGPWQAERDDVPYDGGFETWVVNADGESVCMMDCPADEMEATAHLISAAPDLLQACKAAYHLLQKLGGKNHDPEFSELQAAIYKAMRGADV